MTMHIGQIALIPFAIIGIVVFMIVESIDATNIARIMLIIIEVLFFSFVPPFLYTNNVLYTMLTN
ncbi:hypothetical protein GCM10020331_051460 [Ectobacillus funiculus]